jgi:hypothetical protein
MAKTVAAFVLFCFLGLNVSFVLLVGPLLGSLFIGLIYSRYPIRRWYFLYAAYAGYVVGAIAGTLWLSFYSRTVPPFEEPNIVLVSWFLLMTFAFWMPFGLPNPYDTRRYYSLKEEYIER